jgi:endothelin-converting enzyme/putative endopeptidase
MQIGVKICRTAKNEASKFTSVSETAAQAWCGKAFPAFETMMVTSDPHALDRFRINGALSNDLNFRKAFNCKASQKMVRKNRCEVW